MPDVVHRRYVLLHSAMTAPDVLMPVTREAAGEACCPPDRELLPSHACNIHTSAYTHYTGVSLHEWHYPDCHCHHAGAGDHQR